MKLILSAKSFIILTVIAGIFCLYSSELFAGSPRKAERYENIMPEFRENLLKLNVEYPPRITVYLGEQEDDEKLKELLEGKEDEKESAEQDGKEAAPELSDYDLTGDGVVDGSDVVRAEKETVEQAQVIKQAILDGAGYNAEFDLNEDGLVDGSDVIRAQEVGLEKINAIKDVLSGIERFIK